MSDKLKSLWSQVAICDPSVHDRELQVAISDPQVARYPNPGYPSLCSVGACHVITLTLIALSCIYTRVLTRVQLTSGRESSSNPPMDVG